MSQPPAAITSTGEAEQAIANLNVIMDRLEQTLAEETARVRSGRLREAVMLEETKHDLVCRYAVESQRIGAAHSLIARVLPQRLDTLRQRHVAFEDLLQTNLTVLATAHAVSEGIIRSVSSELARQRTPSTYGASGRTNRPGPKASQPLALSRKL